LAVALTLSYAGLLIDTQGSGVTKTPQEYKHSAMKRDLRLNQLYIRLHGL